MKFIILQTNVHFLSKTEPSCEGTPIDAWIDCSAFHTRTISRILLAGDGQIEFVYVDAKALVYKQQTLRKCEPVD